MFELFDGFTAKANEVVWMARRIAWWLRHNFVSPEILLLGIAGEPNCTAAKVLSSMGVSFENARVQVEDLIGRGSDECALKVPLTAPVQQILQAASRKAKTLGVDYVATTHILLALIERAGKNDHAITVLANLGVDLTKLEEQLLQALHEDKIETGVDTGVHDVGLGVKCEIGKGPSKGSTTLSININKADIKHLDLSKLDPETLRVFRKNLANSDKLLDNFFGAQAKRDELWASLLRSERENNPDDHVDKT